MFTADKEVLLTKKTPELAISFKIVLNNWRRNQNLLQDSLGMSYTVKKRSALLQSLFSPVRNVVLFLNLHNLYQSVD